MIDKIQKSAFLGGEGDKWYERNRDAIIMRDSDPVVDTIQYLELKPKKVLEIGAANGYRLKIIRNQFGSEIAGIEPSGNAVAEGNKDGLNLIVGTADKLPFEDNSFDMIIFGFCLYLVDPEVHFRAIAEADRVLKDNGTVIIFDFLKPKTSYNKYSHLEGLRSNKMEFSKLFTAHPSYNLIHRQLVKKSPNFLDSDNREGIDVLIKDVENAFSST